MPLLSSEGHTVPGTGGSFGWAEKTRGQTSIFPKPVNKALCKKEAYILQRGFTAKDISDEDDEGPQSKK